MSVIIKRLVAAMAALLLAGSVVGCEREDTQMGEQEQPPMGEQQEEPVMGEPGAEQQPGEQPEQAQKMTMQEVQDEVSSDLDMPASAVTFEDQVRQKIDQAQTEFEQKAHATVGTVEYYVNRLDTGSLDSDEQEAKSTIEQNVEQARTILDQMESETQENYGELQSQAEEHIDQVRDGWEELSDKVEPMFEEQPAGGGPMEGQEPMQQEQPAEQDQQPTPNQPSDNY